MISGIGIDIVDIERVRKAMERPTFLGRFFSEEECAFFVETKNAPQTVAVHFAMKEAVAKALGTGIRGFALKEISIVRDALGKPILVPLGRLAILMSQMGIQRIHLSCSHEKKIAIGYALAEKSTL